MASGEKLGNTAQLLLSMDDIAVGDVEAFRPAYAKGFVIDYSTVNGRIQGQGRKRGKTEGLAGVGGQAQGIESAGGGTQGVERSGGGTEGVGNKGGGTEGVSNKGGGVERGGLAAGGVERGGGTRGGTEGLGNEGGKIEKNPTAGLEMVKQVDSATVSGAQTLNFTITLQSEYGSRYKNLYVVDWLDPHFRLRSSNGRAGKDFWAYGSNTGSLLVWRIDKLSKKQRLKFTYRVLATPG